jgi:penicillin-binding protein 1A
VLVAAIWGVIALIAVLAYFAFTLPDIDGVGAPERRPAIEVAAADGTALARYGDQVGDYVTVAELPEHLIHAVLAIEDRRFYSHPGVDLIGVARAAWVNLRAGTVVEGGSTITQQLAKNLFLTPDRTLGRKIQEMLLALWLEWSYSKDEILTAYLNRVYLGAGTYGVDAAARTYFDISARDLNLRQAAMIAGLLRAPSRLSPTSNPDGANARADVVLDAMVAAGFITRAEIAAAGADRPISPATGPADADRRYFTDWVVDQVPEFVGYEPADLAVATTLDPTIQTIAQQAVDRHLAAAADQAVGQAAVIVMRPDGAVEAMVGGRSYGLSQFNRAVQALRQPGSAFKPIVYLAALEAGLSPDSLVEDAPIDLDGWRPSNFTDRYRGAIALRQALADSVNTAAIRVLDHVGVDRTVDLARRLGITSDLAPNLALALGASEVTLLELTGAYAAFANGGQAVVPYGIARITDPAGGLLYRRHASGLGPVAPRWMIDRLNTMLAGVLSEGTGRAAALPWTAAGKTGTSQDFRDAWFIGYSGDRVVGVWVGNDDGRPMDGVTGGGLPAQIWRDIMMEIAALRGVTPLTLDPAGIGSPTSMPASREEQRALDRLFDRMLGEG